MEENQTENQQKLLELKVGIFVLLGLAIIAVMILEFGISREGFRKFYQLTVDIPDANGLLKGSDVQLAGARVGYVSEKPRILPTIGAVAIEVKIFQEIKVPKTAHFEVDSSGLLGDRYISIVMAKDFDPKKFDPSDPEQIYHDGARIEGKRSGGIEELTQKGSDVMDALKAALVKLQATTTDLDKRLDLLLIVCGRFQGSECRHSKRAGRN
jgi:phospholipid/cholesterol/gamma-HCH transport system substrate-binding protein